MRIVFFEVMPGEQELLKAGLPAGHEAVFYPDRLSQDTLAKAKGAQVISVFVKSEIRAALLDQLPDVGLITTRSMGFDHIDVDDAKKRGIKVINVQTYASHPVAEFTFALLLAVARKIVPANTQLREQDSFDQRTLRGFNLFGKTLGVIGTGRIGKNVIAIAQGFGMQVLAYDPMPDDAFATQSHFVYTTLERLAIQSDIITIHAPHTPDTHHLVDAKLFGTMKKGVVIINTARGEIMDTHALVAALKKGIVGGAALDVLEGERDPKEMLAANHALINMPNVLVTPHIAYETVEAMVEITRVTAQAISHFIAGTDQKYL